MDMLNETQKAMFSAYFKNVIERPRGLGSELDINPDLVSSLQSLHTRLSALETTRDTRRPTI